MFQWAEKLFTGYSSADLQAESDKLDSDLAAQNEAAHERGAVSDDVYRETQDNIAAGSINAEAEISGAFDEGLKEGVDNVRGTIGDIVTAPLKLIDWRVWIVGAIALFFYMGGARYL